MGNNDAENDFSFKEKQTEEKAFEDDNYNDEYSPWKKDELSQSIPNLFRNNMVLILGAVVLICILVIFYLLISQPEKRTAEILNLKAEAKLKEFNARLDKLEGITEKINKIKIHEEKYENLSKRLEQVELSVNKRLDQFSEDLEKAKKIKEIEKPKKQVSKKSPPKAPPKSPPKTKDRFHEVRQKETLYSIGRKYDLTVEELVRINGLSAKDILKPGQKLKVSK